VQNVIVVRAIIGDPEGTKSHPTVRNRLFVDGSSSIDFTAKASSGVWARARIGRAERRQPGCT
jgi:hypothetical protein